MKKEKMGDSVAYLIMIMVLLFLPSCSRKDSNYYIVDNFNFIDRDEVTRAVIFASSSLEKKHDLHLVNSVLDGEYFIEGITLEFISQEILEIGPARELVVEIVEEFLHRINENMLLRSQVARRPFSVNDLDIRIHFESFFVKYIDPLYTERIRVIDGIVYYYAATAYNREAEMWHHHQEPYETSVVISRAKKEADMPYMERAIKKSSNIKSFLHFDPIVTPVY